jgi:hypothetical protein
VNIRLSNIVRVSVKCFLLAALLISGAHSVSHAQTGRLAVLLRSDTGQPIVNARAVLVDQLTGKESEFSDTSDAAGRMEFQATPGYYRINVKYQGYAFWGGPVSVPSEEVLTISIPLATLTVSVFQGYQQDRKALAGLKVKVYTKDEKVDLDLSATTGPGGFVTFRLPERPYSFMIEYLGSEYWSEQIDPLKHEITVANGEVKVKVLSSSGPMAGQKIFLFDEVGNFLNQEQESSYDGIAKFMLPMGKYTFRVDYFGMRFFSGLVDVKGGSSQEVQIDTGGGKLQFIVSGRGGDPIIDLPIYLFDASENYLGQTEQTDVEGKVEFYLPNGAFKFRVDMMGYSFWSDLYSMPEQPEGGIKIALNEIKLSLLVRLEDKTIPLAGRGIELLTENDVIVPQNPPVISDSNGEAVFRLPERPYYLRFAYLGQYRKSEVVVWEDAIIIIQQKIAEVRVLNHGKPLEDVPIRLFAGDGRDLALFEYTDENGSATFELPAGGFRFRADILSQQFWSSLVSETSTTINIDHQDLYLKLYKNGDLLEDAFVFLYDNTEERKYLGHSAETDSKGKAKFYVPEGAYLIRVDKMGIKYWSAPLRISAGQPNRHMFDISKWRREQ